MPTSQLSVHHRHSAPTVQAANTARKSTILKAPTSSDTVAQGYFVPAGRRAHDALLVAGVVRGASSAAPERDDRAENDSDRGDADGGAQELDDAAHDGRELRQTRARHDGSRPARCD